MKKVLVILSLVVLLAIGAGAYAYGPNWWVGGPGYGMGQGFYGGAAGCPGPGGYGWYGGYGYDQKFLDETAGLRKELNEKRFEYLEAIRNPDTTPETVTKLEKEIHELQDKIYEKAPRRTYGRFGCGYGCRW